jgi:hypothetical protein
MIFPKQLPYVTFYIPDAEQYYQLGVSGCEFKFTFEPYYTREAISAKRDTKMRGMRFDMDFTFAQTQDHSTMRSLWNNIYALPNSEIRMYLMEIDLIDAYADYFSVITRDFVANHTYSNTIGRHGYNMSFTSALPDLGIGVAYLINEDGVFVLTNEGERIYVDLVY